MKIGDFSLQIISADNKMALFKEHASSDGKSAYMEVEPEIEYFVEVSSDTLLLVYMDLEIDRQMVETAQKLQTGKAVRMGVWWEGRDDRLIQHAFQFDRATVHEVLSLEIAPRFWTRVIMAQFYGDPQLHGERGKGHASLPAMNSSSAVFDSDLSLSSNQTPVKTSAGSMTKPKIIYKVK